jgi:hypothetical protein
MYSVIPRSYSSNNQISHIYNNIHCQFLICESCFWTATILNLVKKWDKNNRHRTALSSCPMCSSKNISMISILTYNDDDADDNDVCKLNTTEIKLVEKLLKRQHHQREE